MLLKGPVSVLVAPLDWGLGHATRCIPIINELLKHGAKVRIAASGPQKNLLVQAFPGLECLELPGYGIRYSRGAYLKWALIAKLPAILKQIKREHKWLAETVQKFQIDIVISDNRYGLYHHALHNVFVTHQLVVQTGKLKSGQKEKGFFSVSRFLENSLVKWNYKRMSKFSCCWIPDEEGEISFAGRLSHSTLKNHVPFRYIGILSRFHYSNRLIVKNTLLILISGPEPQRTDFEEMILNQLSGSNRIVTVVRGLPGPDRKNLRNESGGPEIYNHLPDEKLNRLLLESEYIICRSGYSTIMDLLKLKRTAIIVPTPGQTEQEYLGVYLQEKGWMHTVPEKGFHIEKEIENFNRSYFILPEIPESTLGKMVQELLTDAAGKKAVTD